MIGVRDKRVLTSTRSVLAGTLAGENGGVPRGTPPPDHGGPEGVIPPARSQSTINQAPELGQQIENDANLQQAKQRSTQRVHNNQPTHSCGARATAPTRLRECPTATRNCLTRRSAPAARAPSCLRLDQEKDSAGHCSATTEHMSATARWAAPWHRRRLVRPPRRSTLRSMVPTKTRSRPRDTRAATQQQLNAAMECSSSSNSIQKLICRPTTHELLCSHRLRSVPDRMGRANRRANRRFNPAAAALTARGSRPSQGNGSCRTMTQPQCRASTRYRAIRCRYSRSTPQAKVLAARSSSRIPLNPSPSRRNTTSNQHIYTNMELTAMTRQTLLQSASPLAPAGESPLQMDSKADGPPARFGRNPKSNSKSIVTMTIGQCHQQTPPAAALVQRATPRQRLLSMARRCQIKMTMTSGRWCMDTSRARRTIRSR